jgi:hypothetical protein
VIGDCYEVPPLKSALARIAIGSLIRWTLLGIDNRIYTDAKMRSNILKNEAPKSDGRGETKQKTKSVGAGEL